MDKEGIVKYVMNTPGNTNEQILRLALDGLEGGGGSGGIKTEVVEITAEEALDIYQGNSVEKILTIQDVPSIFAIKSPDGSMLLCYDSVVSEGLHVYRSIADADLNLSCTYYTTNGKLYIATRNVV